MFLQLTHTIIRHLSGLEVFTLECYRISKLLPFEERYAMSQQIRRAALSVHLNIAEGCSRRSQAERKRFYEIARGSVALGDHIINTFKQLTGMIGGNSKS